jgi:anti-sigma B factor antagonist
MRHFSGFGIEVIPARERVVLVLSGELDLDSATDLQSTLDEVRASGFEQIVVDLRAVSFMDSTGIALLMREERKGKTFEISYGEGPVKRLLELTGLIGHFDTRPIALDEPRHNHGVTDAWRHGPPSRSASG